MHGGLQVANSVDSNHAVQVDFAKQPQFVPSFVGLDGKVCRFFAQMTDNVPESLRDNFRERQFTILYYLVDDSIQVIEQRKHNSGYQQVYRITHITFPKHKSPSLGC